MKDNVYSDMKVTPGNDKPSGAGMELHKQMNYAVSRNNIEGNTEPDVIDPAGSADKVKILAMDHKINIDASKIKHKPLDLQARVKVPPIQGWLETKLPNNVMSRLWEYEKTAKQIHIDHGQYLAGNITKSLMLDDVDDWFYQSVVLPQIVTYPKVFGKAPHIGDTTHTHEFIMDKFWVNYQYKHEFNPTHNHGGIYSFVIWMKIPTRAEEQHNLKFTKNVGNPCASSFQFSYSDTDGSSCHYTYAMDPEWEGYMLLFPSRLEHCVFPYYISDDVRISISGNVSLNSENITRLRNPGWGDRLTDREKAVYKENVRKGKEEIFGK